MKGAGGRLRFSSISFSLDSRATSSSLGSSVGSIIRGLSDLRELTVDVLVLERSKADQQPALELSPCRDSLGVLKPIVPLYCVSLKVDDSDVNHRSLRCPVISQVAFRARKLSRRVSLFPSREVHPHA
ncbi:hypothetical protein BHE74_00038475 [Ensete ventricosum]|nr:hypothetical protein BHE74_00038475 [Ensete ventricosum]RZS14433.1 hypothetical protein BHM03_00046117 [Ensete ventricosum]